MKIAEIERKDEKTGEPIYKRHAEGEHKGEVVMRDETRDETMSRLRVKYEVQANSSDAYLAAQARENLDWLSLIDGGASSEPFNAQPIVDELGKVQNDIAKLGERVGKLETRN
jgi:hypothetical protein